MNKKLLLVAVLACGFTALVGCNSQITPTAQTKYLNQAASTDAPCNVEGGEDDVDYNFG